jgi:hypothetical protein
MITSSNSATSQAAKTPFTLVSRYESTSTPREVSMPEPSRNPVFGHIPVPTPNASASNTLPSAVTTDSASSPDPPNANTTSRGNISTPCSSSIPMICSPNTGSIRFCQTKSSGSTSFTDFPFSRSAAASSTPMKLLPLMTAFLALSHADLIMRASSRVQR